MVRYRESLAGPVARHRRTSRCPRHSSRASGTAAPGGTGARCVGRARSPVPVDRAPQTRPDGLPSDGTRRGTQDNRAIIPLAAAPTRCASFRLLTLACRYGILLESDCNNNTLRDATGVKRGDTVGLEL